MDQDAMQLQDMLCFESVTDKRSCWLHITNSFVCSGDVSIMGNVFEHSQVVIEGRWRISFCLLSFSRYLLWVFAFVPEELSDPLECTASCLAPCDKAKAKHRPTTADPVVCLFLKRTGCRVTGRKFKGVKVSHNIHEGVCVCIILCVCTWPSVLKIQFQSSWSANVLKELSCCWPKLVLFFTLSVWL